MLNKTSFINLFLLITLAIICTEQPVSAETQQKQNPVYTITTNFGAIDVELFADQAPQTVANFIGLAEGIKPFIDPRTKKEVKRPFYNGLIFHRVIKDFMIQGGDPLGTGRGGPGFRFDDEIDAVGLGLDKIKAMTPQGNPHPILTIQSREEFQRFFLMPLFKELNITSQEELDKRKTEVQKALNNLTVKTVLENMGYQYSTQGSSHPPKRGILAMANSGPNTNGSQFFINLVDTDWLIGKHTVFGRVLKGMEVVDKIGSVPVDMENKPIDDVMIISIKKSDEDIE